MKAAYLSNTRYSWCTEVHIGRALTELGWEVLFLQQDRETPESVEAKTLEFGADLCLFTRTWASPTTLTDVWRRLEARGITTASYHLDLYLGLEREATLESDPFWLTQFVFTPDGDPQSAAEFARRGINHHWLSPAIDRSECVPGHYRPRYATDVAFVGSPGETYHHEWPWRGELLSWLSATYGNRFQRYGHNAEVVRGEHLNDLYASASIVVGDSLCPKDHGYYWSDRVCETLGRGGVLLHPRVPGLAERMDLVEYEHLLWYDYGNFDELHEKIEWALANQDRARAMATRAQAHILAGHTYGHRLTEALEIMGLSAV